jgi:hypothetical protein
MKSLKRCFTYALKTHNLPSERLKMQPCWCWWSDVSWCRKTIRSHFLYSGNSEKRFEWSHGSVLSSRMALITNILLLDVLKTTLLNSTERCFKVSKGHTNSFCASWHRKKPLGWNCFSDVLSRLMALKTHYLFLDVLKTTLVNSMKRCFKVSRDHTNKFSASWASKKATCVKSFKCWFRYPNGSENS